MNDLFRELAPVTEEAWQEIEDEAKRTLKLSLAARQLVDFTGPLGWETSSVSQGRTEALGAPPAPGVEAKLRQVRRLVEFRVPFELSRRALETIQRGAKNVADLRPVTSAARAAALAEDRAVFHGYGAGQIEGICEQAADRALTLSDDFTRYPGVVTDALEQLRKAGIAGPYSIALGPRCFDGLTKTTVAGYPVIEHVRRVLDGPIVWAPAVNGAAVLSLRGRDFDLTVGRDFSIGYLSHSATTVQLYIEESFTFLNLTPEAGVPLRYASGS